MVQWDVVERRLVMKCGIYEIHTELEHLDTDSGKSSRWGYVETWLRSDDETLFCVRGNLPDYVCKELTKIAEKQGWKYWHNNN